MRTALLVLTLSILAGCSSVRHITSDDLPYEFVSVHAAEADGPGVTALYRVVDGDLELVGVFGAQGYLGAVFSAGGNVASSALIAEGLRDSGTDNSTSVDITQKQHQTGKKIVPVPPRPMPGPD